MGQNALPGFRLALTQEAAVLTSNFTTTNVGTAQLVLSQNIYIPTAEVCLYAFASGTARHSVAGATYDLELHIGVDDTPSAEYVIAKFNALYLPAAAQNMPFHISSGLNVKGNLPAIVRPGYRRAAIYVRNLTAGTLTLEANDSVNPMLHLLSAGDAT